MDLLATAAPQQFFFGPYALEVMVPDPAQIRARWAQRQMPEEEFPFWSKIWPSAKALCTYLAANPALFRGKRVVELGAGLGLPSLLCAAEAISVQCTDRSREAMRFAEASSARNGWPGMRCSVLNWMDSPQPLPCDLLLLSDINYDPQIGEALKALIDRYRQRKVDIVLATPQRPAGRAFAWEIRNWVTESLSMDVTDETGTVTVTLFRIGT